MSIRRTLLLFFLLMGLCPAAALTGLAFFQAREALKQEIIHNLKTQASALMEQIDRMVHERVLQVHTWSELEIMQEIRVGDVDKRLSHLLFDFHKHYKGIYRSLYCTNRKGDVVAASDPGLVGQSMRALPTWLEAKLDNGQTRLSEPILGPTAANGHMDMEASIHEPGHEDDEHLRTVGNLHALFDWAEMFRLLDQSDQSHAGQQRPLVLLFDSQGRIIAASAPFRERGLLLSSALADWRKMASKDVLIADPEKRLGLGKVLSGSATSKGYQGLPGFGWSVQVYQPTRQAFAPIDRMGVAFLVLLVLTSMVAVALSLLIARAIAQPILQLTRLTREFMGTGKITAPILVAKGEVGELTGAFQQMIHDLEQSRENLVRAAKLAVVGEMAATMAHEVRTPLGIMRSSAQMLLREPSLSDTGKEMLGFILDESDRLNKLVSTLLDCARPRPPLCAANHLHAIALRAVGLLDLQAQRKAIQLETKLNAVDDSLDCDEEQILQVILNLLMNAIQILPLGGKVVLRSFAGPGTLTLAVDDNGPGITGHDRNKVFDPFFTRREGGIGLGLAVAQQIARAHSGQIRVEDSPEGGARFLVSFAIPSISEEKHTL